MGDQWVGLGLAARVSLGAGSRACAIALATLGGYSVITLGGTHVLRMGVNIFADPCWSLREQRGQVARGFASGLLERDGMARDGVAIEAVAIELIFPRDEVEQAWHAAGEDLEELDRRYRLHVPAAWIADAVEQLMPTNVVTMVGRKR